MDWQRLAHAIVDRRVDLGLNTREAFLAAMQAQLGDKALSRRVLADLETGRRDNYDQSTLSRLEQALEWPAGQAHRILRGPRIKRSTPAAGDEVFAEGSGSDVKPEPRDIADELMTQLGVHAWLYVNRMDLTEEIHDPRLGPEARYHLIRMVRLDDVERDRQLREKVAAEKERMIEAGEHEA